MKEKTIEQQIIAAVYEFKDIEFKTVEDAVEDYGMIEVFNCWMKSQFLVGYTEPVLQVLERLGIVPAGKLEEVNENEKVD